MKKLMYLLVVGVLFTFTACGGGDTCTHECADDAVCEASTEEGCAGHVADAADGTDDECADDCAKACCLGCKATDGDSKCKEDHSCCATMSCCCGDATCDGSCHDNNEDSESHSHDHNEGHNNNHE